jgi:glycosyltransferase involved in cell wall biosynthesis
MNASMDFRFTGTVTEECRDLVGDLELRARFDGHVPELQLRESYAWADILVCPSIQDGFAVVLSHAQAAGIPFIASTNTGGPDLLAMGGKGWIVPIRSAEAIEAQLSWCDANRHELGAMIEHLYANPVQRSWRDVALEVVQCLGTEGSFSR